MSKLPSGTSTFLFIYVEGSTKLAQQYREQWETMRARQGKCAPKTAIVRAAIKTVGDGRIFGSAKQVRHQCVQEGMMPSRTRKRTAKRADREARGGGW